MLFKKSTGSLIGLPTATEDLGIKISSIIEKVDPDTVYAVVRGIQGDMMNENHDLWQWKSELCQKRANDGLHTWQTWQGKPICVQHKNDGPLDHYGRVLECWPSEKEASVYMLLGTDRKLNPQLANGIERGIINKVSMGCAVEHSTCTYCGHEAKTVNDYCDHIRYEKGRPILIDHNMNYCKAASIGNGSMVRIGEDCHNSTGLEMSWVKNPAFLNSTVLELLTPDSAEEMPKAASISSPVIPIPTQYVILGKALQHSQYEDDRKAGVLLEKMASNRSSLTSAENDSILELFTLLGLI